MANEHEPHSPEGEGPRVVPTQALVPDQLVDSLVPDPSQPPTPTVSLLGLLGRSAKEGHWRLYFSTSLKRYTEFKEEDVLHSVKVPRAQPPFLGMEATRVWIRADAEIEYTRHESRRVQANSPAARWPMAGEGGQEGFLAAFMPINPPDDGVRTPIDPPDGTQIRGLFAARSPIDGTPELLLWFMPSVPKPIPEPI